MSRLLYVLFVGHLASGFEHFRAELPNGYQVPNPCDGGKSYWPGVGHEDHRGAGAFNPFGNAFKANGKKWSAELCRLDSDGDGRTNGEELGDPGCVWSKGDTPSVSDPSKLSHPGVCEPLTDPACLAKNTFLLDCAALGVTTPATSSWCPAIEDNGVKRMDLQYKKFELTAEETQYTCRLFDLPSDEEYEIIAWEPIIDNRAIFHHMIVFGCGWLPPVPEVEATKLAPRKCPMIPAFCGAMMIVWAYGIRGQCYTAEYSVPFGKGDQNVKQVILQHHYNNDVRRPGFVDSSGVTIYYQRKKRPIAKGLIAIGEQFLRIPPKTPRYDVVATLSSSCTARLLEADKKYYLLSLLVHIHKQGSYGKMVLHKKKAGYSIVLVDEELNYDRPKTAIWTGNDRILLEPGDEITVTCGYNTMNKEKWSFFGSQTSDEMCFYFIDLYPRPYGQIFSMVPNTGSITPCTPTSSAQGGWGYGDCDYFSFYQKFNQTTNFPAGLDNTTLDLVTSCACQEVYPAEGCTASCYSQMTQYNLMGDPCLQDDAIFQTGMRRWFDDSEILHRAFSQMQQCQKLRGPPSPQAKCFNNRGNSAPSLVTTSPTMALMASVVLGICLAKI